MPIPTSLQPRLNFLTAGSVDDGKSTLIGRLLFDNHAILTDQMAGLTCNKSPEKIDFAKLTDGLQTEREQSISIDVAYRYFATPQRQFMIADAPGHKEYTRHMVTAASNSDAAVILVDATKLPWQTSPLQLLPQTCRHALLAHLLRVPSIIFAINKLDAVSNPALAYTHIQTALQHFAHQAHINIAGIIPISALHGINLTHPITQAMAPDTPEWVKRLTQALSKIYQGPSLLQLLTNLPTTPAETQLPLHFPIQLAEKTHHHKTIYWGRIATGTIQTGQTITLQPNGIQAQVAHLQANASNEAPLQCAQAGHSVGIMLHHEINACRGDWFVSSPTPTFQKQSTLTLAWLGDTPLTSGQTYWAKHGHSWNKAKVLHISHKLNIQTLQPQPAHQLHANEIGEVTLQFEHPLPLLPYAQSRQLGALILVDRINNHTAAAGMVKTAGSS